MRPDTVLCRSADQVSVVIDSAVVAMRASDGVYLTIEDVGTQVWALLAESITFGELCARLCSEYEVDPTTCEHDVAVFLDGLRSEGMVDVTTPV